MQYKVGDKVWVAMLITDWHENGSDAEVLDEHGSDLVWVKAPSAPAAEQAADQEPSAQLFSDGDLVGIKPHSGHYYIVDGSYIDKSSKERYYAFYDPDSGRYLAYAESVLYDWLAEV